jgi:phosphonate transport system ATP-binding protein
MGHEAPAGGARRPSVAVEVAGLRKAFGARPLFEDLSFTVAAGEALAVIGANGTGKSTALRALVRLTEVDAGRIVVLGEDVRALQGAGLRRYRAGIGFVFQRHNLVGRLSALSNVVHGVQARARGPRTWVQWLATDAVRREAMACLHRVGLADRALQRADSLSGGQSQRVAIARMLMQRPRLVIADEPDASLDPKAGAEIMDLLFRLTREEGLALIFVSHHMEHAMRYADRIIGLEGGRVALDQAAEGSDVQRLKDFFKEAA